MTRYDERTALVIVDVQNDFADPSGSLAVRGGPQVVDAANVEISAAGAAGAVCVYTQDWHPPDTPHFAKDGGTWPVHCVHDTWGAQLAERLKVTGPIVRKGTGGEDGYSGFTTRDPQTETESPTELAALLRERGVERVVVIGLATDYCVKETAADAVRLGFETTVVRPAIRPVDLTPGDGDRALNELRDLGVTIAD